MLGHESWVGIGENSQLGKLQIQYSLSVIESIFRKRWMVLLGDLAIIEETCGPCLEIVVVVETQNKIKSSL